MFKTEKFKIKFSYYDQDGKRVSANSPKKVITLAEVVRKDNGDVLAGEAWCGKYTKEEIFSKPVGRKIALTRALGFVRSKEERAEIWREYLARHNR